MLKSFLIGMLMLAVRIGKTWNLSDQISQRFVFRSHKASGGLAKAVFHLIWNSWFTDPVSFHPMASSPLYVSVGRQFSLDFLGSYMVWTFPRKGCWWVSFKADWIANWRYRTFLFLETFQEEKVPFFPGGQVVKILCFHCRGQGLNPWI